VVLILLKPFKGAFSNWNALFWCSHGGPGSKSADFYIRSKKGPFFSGVAENFFSISHRRKLSHISTSSRDVVTTSGSHVASSSSSNVFDLSEVGGYEYPPPQRLAGGRWKFPPPPSDAFCATAYSLFCLLILLKISKKWKFPFVLLFIWPEMRRFIEGISRSCLSRKHQKKWKIFDSGYFLIKNSLMYYWGFKIRVS